MMINDLQNHGLQTNYYLKHAWIYIYIYRAPKFPNVERPLLQLMWPRQNISCLVSWMQVHACLSRHYSGIIPILTFLHSEDHIWMWIESDRLYVLLRLVFHVIKLIPCLNVYWEWLWGWLFTSSTKLYMYLVTLGVWNHVASNLVVVTLWHSANVYSCFHHYLFYLIVLPLVFCKILYGVQSFEVLHLFLEWSFGGQNIVAKVCSHIKEGHVHSSNAIEDGNFCKWRLTFGVFLVNMKA